MVIHFKELQGEYPQLKGVFVGGCIAKGEGSSFRAKAHAHTQENDPYKGWICVRSLKRVYIKGTKKASMLIRHELAHLLVKPYYYHNKQWQKTYKRLNKEINEIYKKEMTNGSLGNLSRKTK